MVITGIVLVLLSGICNGLFTVPLKLETRWRWENVWFIFIVTSCLALPWIVLQLTTPAYRNILLSAPPESVTSACVFGFIWGFGAICFGRSVHLLGVSLANSLVLGISAVVHRCRCLPDRCVAVWASGTASRRELNYGGHAATNRLYFRNNRRGYVCDF